MSKGQEYQNWVKWAKKAHTYHLINELVGTCRYRAPIREELQLRMRADGCGSLISWIWADFEKRLHETPLEPQSVNNVPGAFLVQLRENRKFWEWAVAKGMSAFTNGAEPMWKKCFDERLTSTPKNGLTEGELGLIRAFENALRDFNIDNEHDFWVFLNTET